MKQLQLINSGSKIVLVSKLLVANTIWERTVGLLNRSCLYTDEGLLIKPCSGVHTFGMRFPIDILFLDGELRALRCMHTCKPWRMAGPVRKAKCVVELHAGILALSKVEIGDRFEITSGTER